MIVFVNGTFGVGKSSVASELKALFNSSSICDLEDLGQISKSATESIRSPDESTDDFQDIPLWRTLSAAALTHLANGYPSSTIIVPMTIGRIDYLHEVIAGVCERSDFWHFCLTAPIDTIRSRLRSRGDPSGPQSWGMRKAELYVPNFQSEAFRIHIPCENRSSNEIAREIKETIAG